MKAYLVAQDLWDVVEADQAPDEAEALKAWKKTNAAALHAIQISCSSDAFSEIRQISSAKSAWDTLAEKFDEAANENNAQNDVYNSFFNDVGKGCLTKVKDYLTLHPEAVRGTSPTFGLTALHVAVTFGHLPIVEVLVNLMTPKDLEIQERESGLTAFDMAVGKGNIAIAKCMVEKNQKLLSVVNSYHKTPIAVAITSGQKEMARYLYPLTLQHEVLFLDNGEHGAYLMSRSIYNKMFDIVHNLATDHPHLIIAKDNNGNTPIDALTYDTDLFPSGCQLKFWRRWIYNSTQIYVHKRRINFVWFLCVVKCLKRCIHQIYELKVVHTRTAELLNHMCEVIETLNENEIREAEIVDAIERAASHGIIEIVTNISKAIPKATWNIDLAKTIFEAAIRNREAEVFSLIYGIDDKQRITDLYDSNSDGLLHVTGYIPNSRKLNRISGAALQMQSEMQWYKEVEAITPEGSRTYVNDNSKTAREVFTENHKDLLIAGETWMKSTSSSCTFVGALIFTIMFTAAFTLPGGNKQDTGFPMFLDEKLFKVFIIFDAISLFSSTTSVLTFLGILTSRYAEEDFLTSLPNKMILGLSMLFISIAAMMTAFCAVIALLFHKQLWIVVPTILLATIPVILFVGLQFPLLVEIFISTYGRSIFNRKVGNWLA
ncbi:hypothetical protein UlMin_004737 [Ulmus minor]